MSVIYAHREKIVVFLYLLKLKGQVLKRNLPALGRVVTLELGLRVVYFRNTFVVKKDPQPLLESCEFPVSRRDLVEVSTIGGVIGWAC